MKAASRRPRVNWLYDLNRNIFELQATFNIHDSLDDVEHSGGLKIFESNHKFREKKHWCKNVGWR